ncbi:putative transcription factor WD40-like family [Helianthus debilis subsp. tardiflorus]
MKALISSPICPHSESLHRSPVIRPYYGHLSGVYCLALHPTIDVLTGGRDSVCRVWDIRSKMQIHALSGHGNTVCSVFTRPTVSNTALQLNSTSISLYQDPQVVTGSYDSTIKFWDLRYEYIPLIGSDDARYTLLGVPNFE